MPTRKPRLSVVVDEDLLRYLEQWATFEERSVSNLVVVILKQAVGERRNDRSTEEAIPSSPKRNKVRDDRQIDSSA